MKKAIITLLCIIGCLQMNAQRVYTEEGKYYEMGYVEYGTSSKSASATAAFILPRISTYSDFNSRVCTDDNGKKIKFNNFFACINYFMAKGWSILDINLSECVFVIRKEISKQEAERLAQECIKERK